MQEKMLETLEKAPVLGSVIGLGSTWSWLWGSVGRYLVIVAVFVSFIKFMFKEGKTLKAWISVVIGSFVYFFAENPEKVLNAPSFIFERIFGG